MKELPIKLIIPGFVSKKEDLLFGALVPGKCEITHFIVNMILFQCRPNVL